MKRFLLPLLISSAGPAFAASGPFFSLYNTNFVVLLAFISFVSVLLYLRVPKMLGSMLDKRAEDIQAELNQARELREEAQAILASFQRKQHEVEEQSRRIVETAQNEAAAVAAQAKEDLKESIARRLRAAEEQIASAEAQVTKEVRERAINVAIEAAGATIAKSLKAREAGKLIDQAIDNLDLKIH